VKPDGQPYKGRYIFRVRVWRNGAWRDEGNSWGLTELVDQSTNKGLLKIEHRPKLATYTGVYRYEDANVIIDMTKDTFLWQVLAEMDGWDGDLLTQQFYDYIVGRDGSSPYTVDELDVWLNEKSEH